MASIRRRQVRYHVQIRKNGYPSVTKTLIHLKTAKKWASGVYEKAITCYLPHRVDIKFSLSEQIGIELHIGEQFISILGY